MGKITLNPSVMTELPAKRKYHGATAYTSEQLKKPLRLFPGEPLEATVLLTVTYGLHHPAVYGCDAKDIQAWLGHSDSTTTLDVYGHVLGGDMDRLGQVMDPLLLSRVRLDRNGSLRKRGCSLRDTKKMHLKILIIQREGRSVGHSIASKHELLL